MGFDPREDFAVAETFGEFGFQRFMVEAGEGEEMAVHAFPGVMVFAEFAGDGGAAFVEDAREENVTAQPHTGAARGALGEVGRGVGGIHNMILVSMFWKLCRVF